MTTPLEELPEEIKVLLTKYLGVTDLTSLVLTSTAMKDSAQEELNSRTRNNQLAKQLSAKWVQYADKKDQLTRLVEEQLAYLQSELGTMQQRAEALVAGIAELKYPRPDVEDDEGQ